MRGFIIDILVGLIVFLGTWCVGETALEKAGVNNNYSYKYHYVKDNSSIKILLTGSSHIENGLNPYLMGDSVFDFAIGGRDNWRGWEQQLAEELYPTMPNLKVVITSIGYGNVYSSYHYQDLRDVDKEWLYMYSKNMHVYYDRYPEYLYYQSALLNNKMGLKYWINENVDSLGYSKLVGHQENWREQQQVDSERGFSDLGRLAYDENVQYITQIAKVCYENGIRFIVITSPCANCYIARTNEKGMKDIYDLVDRVREHYPVEYRNYLDDPEFRADSIYYNSSHLNSIGADMFTKRVVKDFGL